MTPFLFSKILIFFALAATLKLNIILASSEISRDKMLLKIEQENNESMIKKAVADYFANQDLNSKKQTPKWYDTFSMRGYTQVRNSRLFESNSQYICDQCDKSLGAGNNFFIRRARLVFSGNAHDRVSFYIQPDMASDATKQNYFNIRDIYFDLFLDSKKEFRFRIGQSKIPFGFENMQSSSNRLALDRSDSLNSMVPNERDLGVFFYWAPSNIRSLFSELLTNQQKGSGDYGVFALGAFNGQTANSREENNNLHLVSRLTYPWQIGLNQILETSIQVMSGKYLLTGPGQTTQGEGKNFRDQRYAASLVLYPRPIGFQAEYNIGIGPQFDETSQIVKSSHLKGGYAQLSFNAHIGTQSFIPFIKYQHYKGGKKHEAGTFHQVKEGEIGIEWLPIKALELTAMWSRGSRRVTNINHPQGDIQRGHRLRLQAQINY